MLPLHNPLAQSNLELHVLLLKLFLQSIEEVNSFCKITRHWWWWHLHCVNDLVSPSPCKFFWYAWVHCASVACQGAGWVLAFVVNESSMCSVLFALVEPRMSNTLSTHTHQQQQQPHLNLLYIMGPLEHAECSSWCAGLHICHWESLSFLLAYGVQVLV